MRNITEKCSKAGLCGGCRYQGTDYGDQLHLKEDEVRLLFSNSEVSGVEVCDIKGCEDIGIYGYRNKMEYTFGDEVKDGPLTLGMHRIKNYMSVVTVDQCQLVSEDFNKILSYTLEFCVRRGYPKYHKKDHRGLLRNLIVRRGVRTGELLVNIVTSSQSEFDEDTWKTGLLSLSLHDDVVGVMHTVNDSPADAVNCDESRVLFGRDYYYEEMNGLRFRVGEFSFFQTNVPAVERLYDHAVSLLKDVHGKKVFDLYCGTGTISQILARRARSVVGVEIVEDSVESARENASINGLSNCSFVCGDVFEVLSEFEDTPDVIVVDPPRAGISDKSLAKIASYGVPEILYISCNPKTLVKNMEGLSRLGYTADRVYPYDNFPLTRHVECVCLMSSTNVGGHV